MTDVHQTTAIWPLLPFALPLILAVALKAWNAYEATIPCSICGMQRQSCRCWKDGPFPRPMKERGHGR